MDEKVKETVGLFRFGVIFPLLKEGLPRGERSRMVKEISLKTHEIPFSTKTTLCKNTVWNWYYMYIKSGRDLRSLEPKDRNDKGSSRALDEDTQAEILEKHGQDPSVRLTTIVRDMENDGHEEIPMSSVYRLVKDWEKSNKEGSAVDRRRFECENCNDMWMCDAMVLSDPKVVVEKDGKKMMIKPRCFAFIDDRSRLITHAQFYEGEKGEHLIDCMWKAFNKHGLPLRVFTDSGAAMKDMRLQRGLAELEVQLSYATPYAPQGKAKVERFWRTLREQFVPTLPKEGLTLFELNNRLDKYIASYNQRFHSGIGTSPAKRYFSEVMAVRPAPADLPKHFRVSETRKVSLARTVQFQNKLLEVPIGYAGKKIELRYFDPDEVEGFFEGKSLGILSPVDLVHNSLAHRIGKEDSNG